MLLVIASLCVGIFTSGYLVGYYRPFAVGPKGGTPAQLENEFKPFWEAWDLIQSNYIGRPVDSNQLAQGALKGMIDSLHDPYSYYLSPDEFKEYHGGDKKTFEGVGIEVGMRNNKLTIIAPIEDSPAEKAGIKAGDIIVEIDGEDAAKMTLEEATTRLRGPKGTQVTIAVERQGFTQSLKFTITRDVIHITPVSSRVLSSQIGYLKLSSFSDDAANEFKKGLSKILEEKPKGIILDLRHNPGGFVDAAIEVASQFIKSGPVMIEDTGRGQRKTIEARSGGQATDESLALVVLIDGGTASASEIVAGALQDRGRGKLVGTKSFGKGVEGVMHPLSDNSALQLTVANWLTPNGRSIKDTGLTPDVVVEMTEADIAAGRDPQLDKAVELLTGGQ